MYVYTSKLDPQAWLLLEGGKDKADLEGFDSWLEGFLLKKKKKGEKSKANMIEDLTVIYWG